jgi:hypothetical protein
MAAVRAEYLVKLKAPQAFCAATPESAKIPDA